MNDLDPAHYLPRLGIDYLHCTACGREVLIAPAQGERWYRLAEMEQTHFGVEAISHIEWCSECRDRAMEVFRGSE